MAAGIFARFRSFDAAGDPMPVPKAAAPIVMAAFFTKTRRFSLEPWVCVFIQDGGKVLNLRKHRGNRPESATLDDHRLAPSSFRHDPKVAIEDGVAVALQLNAATSGTFRFSLAG